MAKCDSRPGGGSSTGFCCLSTYGELETLTSEAEKKIIRNMSGLFERFGKRRDILTGDRQQQQQQCVLKCSRGVSNGMQKSEKKYISSPTDVWGWWTLPACKHGKEFRKHILKYMMTHRGYANLVPQRAKRHVIFFTFYCHKMMHSFTDGVHRLFNLHSFFLYSTMTVEIIIQVTASPFLKDDSSLPF